MELNSTMKLLSKICVHYPALEKHFRNDAGDFRRIVVEEWHRVIGFLDYDEALERLDAYMQSEKAGTAPKASALLRSYRRRPAAWDGPEYMPTYHIESGQLYDEEQRLYAVKDNPLGIYHYNSAGEIADEKGRRLADILGRKL